MEKIKKSIRINPYISNYVCSYCKDKVKIFQWEFAQFVECVVCKTEK